MKKRIKLSKRYNRKNFRNTARRTHRKNLVRKVMRGGIRF